MHKTLKQYAPLILSTMAGIGVVGTAILSSKAALKYDQIQKEASQNTTSETIRTASLIYLPVIALGTATIVCIFGANVLNRRNQAALISAYALLDQSYKEYKSKLIELHGEEVHQEIMESIAVDKVKDTNIYAMGLTGGLTLTDEDNPEPKRLFYDELSKRYFEKTLASVIEAEYHLNRNYMIGGEVSLNDFYIFLGLDPTEFGDTVGWSIKDDLFWIDFNHRKVTLDDGLECYILEIPYGPTIDYRDY